MLDVPQPSEREKREHLRLQRKLARQDTLAYMLPFSMRGPELLSIDERLP